MTANARSPRSGSRAGERARRTARPAQLLRPADVPAADRRGARRRCGLVASSAGRTPPGASAGPRAETRRRGSAGPGRAGDAGSATAVEIARSRREACAGSDASRRSRRLRSRHCTCRATSTALTSSSIASIVGKTPLDTERDPPGRHQVNVSAEGYDGVSEGVNVAESGSTRLHVSLKTVRLDVSVPVVHKHAWDHARARCSRIRAAFATRRQTRRTPSRCRCPTWRPSRSTTRRRR